MLDRHGIVVYAYGMKKTTAVRTGINLTAADLKIICKLKRQFEAEHGKQTATSVIRIALRKAVQV